MPKTTITRDNAIERLEAASSWLITEAAGSLYKAPSSGHLVQAALIERFRLRSYNYPALDSQTGTPRFIPYSCGIFYDIAVIATEGFASQLYEFWRIAKTSQTWSGSPSNSCWFLVTKSSSRISNRSILKKEREFFSSFEAQDRTIFNLQPRSDSALCYKLAPWLFRTSFDKYPDLVNNEVVILQDGSHTSRPIAKPSLP